MMRVPFLTLSDMYFKKYHNASENLLSRRISGSRCSTGTGNPTVLGVAYGTSHHPEAWVRTS